VKVLYLLVTRGHPIAAAGGHQRYIAQRRPDWDVKTLMQPYCVAVARNTAVKQAREGGYDFLYMIDDDVIPNSNVVNLVEHNLPVVGGVVPCWKEGTFFWNAFDLEEDGTWHSVGDFVEKGCQVVYGVGTAIMCIRMKDIAGIAAPFNFMLTPEGTVPYFGGEDIAFCRRCHAKDIPIAIDPTVVGEHCTELELAATMNYARTHTDYRGTSVISVDTRKHQVSLEVGRDYRGSRWGQRRDGRLSAEAAD